MSDFPLTWMAQAFRKNGLRVKEVEGWKNRGRPGTFAPRGVMFHHTASSQHGGAAPSLATCVRGRPDVTGPLCHVLVGRDGTVHVIAAGRANHAGSGGPWRNIPRDSGNAFTVGVEVENNGVGERFSDELLEACDVVFATLLLGLRRRSGWLVGHKEWAPQRKIDPGGIEMNRYRNRVRAEIRRLAAGGPRPQPQPGGTYVVKRGDTLFDIARRHRMSVDELKRLNGLTSDLIRVGDVLRVRS